MWGWNGGWGLAILWGILMWLLPAALIGLVVWLIVGPQRRAGRQGDALEALRLRLAKGEITEEDYRRLKDLLT